MKKVKPPKLDWKWRSTKEDLPPAGEYVIFFVVGRVEVGQEVYDPIGKRQRFTISGIATAKRYGYVQCEYDDYTHWMPLPQARIPV